jgi:hypothetical protein
MKNIRAAERERFKGAMLPILKVEEAISWRVQVTSRYGKRRGNKLSPRASRRNLALLTPWIQTSDLQNCKKINLCCFKPLSLWDFVSAAGREDYSMDFFFFFWLGNHVPTSQCSPLEIGYIYYVFSLQVDYFENIDSLHAHFGFLL